MVDSQIHEAVRVLQGAVQQWQTPAVTIVSQREVDPFKVLISCILSLRTRDKTTAEASARLFSIAGTAAGLADMPLPDLERAIYPVGFYRNKAAQIKELCRVLIDRYNGEVPDDIDELLKLRGVGRKTANLVLGLGFGKPAICVDTHVHRICNRWGYIATKNPEETERVLRAKLPLEYWVIINDLLVTFGQNQCTPLSPKCSTCPLFGLCERVGVKKMR